MYIISLREHGQRYFVHGNKKSLWNSDATVFQNRYSALQTARNLKLNDFEILNVDDFGHTDFVRMNVPTIPDKEEKENKMEPVKSIIPETQKKNVFETLQEQLSKALERINSCVLEDIEREIKRAHGVA